VKPRETGETYISIYKDCVWCIFLQEERQAQVEKALLDRAKAESTSREVRKVIT
jgi:hypothetical protein